MEGAKLTIKSVLEKKSIGYWDFADSRLLGIHKISAYPATMVPDMQKELIKAVIEEDPTIKNILDPFHGSGVTLVEGASLGLNPIGFDINPLANLITRVKLQGVSKKSLKTSLNKMEKVLMMSDFEFPLHDFTNIHKWFRDDIIESLSKIRAAIQAEKYKNIRQYYWVCLINCIKKYSNTRTSTFKLHIKNEENIQGMKNNVVNDFLNSINTSHKFLPEFSREKSVSLFIGDTINLIGKIEDNSIDIICTSPPYGDNATTVTYGQYSMLPIYWIDRRDLGVFDETLIENYSSIDSASLGGNKKKTNRNFHYSSQILEEYLEKIDERKQKKVRRFVEDYLEVFSNLETKLKPGKYMVLTLGNRRVDNQVLPLTEITKEFLEEQNLTLESELMRNIPTKRMPRRVSKVKNHSVVSMNTEYILIMKKERDWNGNDEIEDNC